MESGLYCGGPLDEEEGVVLLPPATLASQARFSVRWASLAGGGGGGVASGGRSSEAKVLAASSRFLGGRHSLLRSWLDFMSNQERSNECLPPKKRELAASTLASEDRPPLATPPPPPPASDAQRTENLAWLASVAGGNRTTPSSSSNGPPQYKPLSMSDSSPCSSSSQLTSSSLRLVSSLPTVYASSMLPTAAAAGPLHYAPPPLPHNLQFIASPYTGHSHYAGYAPSSQLLPPPPPPPPVSSSALSNSSSSSQASKFSSEHQRASASMPPPSTDYHPVHGSSSLSSLSSHSSSLRTVQSHPHHHHHHHPHLPPPPPPPPSLHTHHQKLSHGISQLVVQYADPAPFRRGETEMGVLARGGGGSRELHNGGEQQQQQQQGERVRRSGPGGGPAAKMPHKTRGTPPSISSPSPSPSLSSSSPYEAHPLVLPAGDYAAHDASVLRTSYMLMPNNSSSSSSHHQDSHALQTLPGHLEKGKHRAPPGIISSTASSTFNFPPPASVSSPSPHTVIQTTHGATELLSLGLPASGHLYPQQPPIFGYIAGGTGGQQQQQQQQQQHHHHHLQQPISYHHASLQQHLLIPGSQPVIIPISGGGVATMESAASHVSSLAPPPPPQTYVAGPKREQHHPQTDSLRLAPPPPPPPLPATTTSSSCSSSTSSSPAPPSLPPYFARGSIIQLAGGELKRVEELKTEDFLQSAEVSGELKIDSSTVERIDQSPAARHLAVVRFSVGEHRSQLERPSMLTLRSCGRKEALGSAAGSTASSSILSTLRPSGADHRRLRPLRRRPRGYGPSVVPHEPQFRSVLGFNGGSSSSSSDYDSNVSDDAEGLLPSHPVLPLPVRGGAPGGLEVSVAGTTAAAGGGGGATGGGGAGQVLRVLALLLQRAVPQVAEGQGDADVAHRQAGARQLQELTGGGGEGDGRKSQGERRRREGGEEQERRREERRREETGGRQLQELTGAVRTAGRPALAEHEEGVLRQHLHAHLAHSTRKTRAKGKGPE
ncbi:hypothetical protein CRUP_008982 [Coryphaenoides rupestris]|nr:hypothetical protein CRUP_008982 [Coryphaenoides rupestris]